MSISSTLLARERTDGTRWDWSALPVLLSSGGLVWMPTYVNTSSGIRELRDLKGKRFGMPDYHMTAALWLRITLKDLYGIEARDVTWYNGRSRGMSRDEVLGLDKDPPPGVNLNYIDEGQRWTPCSIVESWTRPSASTRHMPSPAGPTRPCIAGVHRWPATPDSVLCSPMEARRSWRSTTRSLAGSTSRTTTSSSRTAFCGNTPGRPCRCSIAFQQSKQVSYERWKDARSGYLVFEGDDYQEQAATFGEDPFPIGMRLMRKTIERAIQGSLEQGLIRKPVRVEDIYAAATLDT